MSKKHVLLGLGLTLGLAASAARAERKYGMAGCGLGSIMFGTKSMQTSAATFNDSFGSQSWGILSGTSNCQPSGKGSAQDERQQEDFFVANFATLSKEVAQGDGEALVAFAGVLGCADAVTPAVAGNLRDGYGRIFSRPGAVAAFDAARDSLRADAALAAECVKL